jgi:hypothetical protein
VKSSSPALVWLVNRATEALDEVLHTSR